MALFVKSLTAIDQSYGEYYDVLSFMDCLVMTFKFL